MLTINKSYPCKKGCYGEKRSTSKIKYIVIHYTGNKKDTAKNNAKYFATSNDRLASAHYFVDDKEIYQSVEDNYVAWSVGGSIVTTHHPYYKIATNSNTLNIEMCTSGDYDVSATTENNTIELVKYLMNKYGISASHVIRHYDVTGKSCPCYRFRDSSGDWEAFLNCLKGKVQSVTTTSSNTTNITNTSSLIAIGQQHTINYTGHKISTDGIYGKNTKANIIRCFQKAMNTDYKANLTVDGVCGKNTINALGKHYVKKGETQELVRAVQIALYCYSLDPNGTDSKFGSNTEKAVKEFQKVKGLSVDGIAGKNTILALMNV